MPSPNPTSRREYKGAAAATTLQSGIAAGDTSLTLVAANNWPTGAVGNFIITIDRGQANEERILCASQASRVVTVAGAGRGFDGTTASSHSAGATVECTLSAFDADEWNAHTAATTGIHGLSGALVGTTDTQTLTNKTLTAPSIATITNGGTVTVPSTTDTLVGKATTDTLSNKTIDTANSNTVKVNGNTLAATAGTATVTVPNSTDTLVGRATTDTLTNKTLTTPIIASIKTNGGAATVTLPTSTDTLVGQATTDTLTNKTLTSPTINNGTINSGTLDSASTIGGVSGTTLAAATGTWTAFTPTWTATGTAPSIGSGELAMRYMKLGKTVFIEFRFIMADDTNVGTGGWSFSLPVAVSANLKADAREGLRGFGGNSIWPVLAILTANSTSLQLESGGKDTASSISTTSSFYGGTTPVVWASGYEIKGTFFYESV